jgi:hypothetical protein
MTDIDKQLLDYSIHHQVNLGRYSGKVVRDILALLNDADKEILAKILARGEDGTFTAARLKKLLAELREMTGEAYRQAHNELKTAMLDFAGTEAAATVSLLAAQVPVTFNIVQPTAEQLAAIVSKAPVTVGPDKKLLLEEIFTSLAKNKEEAIRGRSDWVWWKGRRSRRWCGACKGLAHPGTRTASLKRTAGTLRQS